MSDRWGPPQSNYKIPLPPLEVQEQIVAELDSYQKIIDGGRQVVENYKPHIDIDPEWEIVELGDVVKVNAETVDPQKKYGKDKFIYIDITSVENGTGVISFLNEIQGDKAPSRARRMVKNGDILLSTVRPNLKAFCYLEDIPDKVLASTGFAVLSRLPHILTENCIKPRQDFQVGSTVHFYLIFYFSFL